MSPNETVTDVPACTLWAARCAHKPLAMPRARLDVASRTHTRAYRSSTRNCLVIDLASFLSSKITSSDFTQQSTSTITAASRTTRAIARTSRCDPTACSILCRCALRPRTILPHSGRARPTLCECAATTARQAPCPTSDVAPQAGRTDAIVRAHAMHAPQQRPVDLRARSPFTSPYAAALPMLHHDAGSPPTMERPLRGPAGWRGDARATAARTPSDEREHGVRARSGSRDLGGPAAPGAPPRRSARALRVRSPGGPSTSQVRGSRPAARKSASSERNVSAPTLPRSLHDFTIHDK